MNNLDLAAELRRLAVSLEQDFNEAEPAVLAELHEGVANAPNIMFVAANVCRERAKMFRDFAERFLSVKTNDMPDAASEFAQFSAECMKLRAEGCDACADALEKL